MPKHIPRPEPSPTPQPLIAGLPLEKAHSWTQLLRFSGLFFAGTWLLLTLALLLWQRSFWALLEAPAWSVLATLVAAGLSLLDKQKAQLTLRNQVLQLRQKGQVLWSHPLSEPFYAALLYRDHREDALLLLQDEDGQCCYLYGRYRNEAGLPAHAIAASPLSFSLAQEALDHFGAWMMPDRNAEHLPALTHMIYGEPGLGQTSLQLPLRRSEQILGEAGPLAAPLRLSPQRIQWIDVDPSGREHLSSLMYHALAAQPFQHQATPSSPPTLLYCLEADPFAQETASASPLWLRIEWPEALSIAHLPHAPKDQIDDALTLSPVEITLLLHTLSRRGVLQAPFALFS